MHLHGFGNFPDEYQGDLIELKEAAGGQWKVGQEGVERILTPKDKKVEFLFFKDKTLAYVKSAMGYPALYPLVEPAYEKPAEAVLMDLDGTSVYSEPFWIWTIERTTSRLLGNPGFKLSHEDEPHVAGHSVSEHLQYCIKKYCPEKTVVEARQHYFDIVRFELAEIAAGRGNQGAFVPQPGLKEFLMTLKKNKVRIGLVTSGLFEKAWPEIIAAFRTLDMGDPLAFYDCIISAGTELKKGQAGTLGELEPKPHPWLYSETARVGLGLDKSKSHRVIGMEDSGAGIVSVRLAGFPVIGVGGGNITSAGVRPLVNYHAKGLMDSLPFILK
jgi:beta-phosphoglucomutase